MNVWKADPTFTNFVPRTAEEAVDRYVRCRRNGLKPMLVPECLIQCSRGLPPNELDQFEAWIINPSGDISAGKLVPSTAIRVANDSMYKETLQRVESALAADPLPPLPYTGYEQDGEEWDEKMPDPPLLQRSPSVPPDDTEMEPIELTALRRQLAGTNLGVPGPDFQNPLPGDLCEPLEA